MDHIRSLNFFIMKKLLVFLLLFLIPLSHAQSEVLPTSYWGYVTENGILKPNSSITVFDGAGREIAQNISHQGGLYQITVPWDDPATPAIEGVAAGETITFKVNGKIATSKVIDAQGSPNRLDLAINTIATVTPYSSSGGMQPDQTSTPAQVWTATATPAQTVTETMTPVQTVEPTEIIQTATNTPTPTPTPLSTPVRSTPGFGVITAIFVLIYIAFARNFKGK